MTAKSLAWGNSWREMLSQKQETQQSSFGK